jgi:hypothetical protein
MPHISADVERQRPLADRADQQRVGAGPALVAGHVQAGRVALGEVAQRVQVGRIGLGGDARRV